jgi:UDP-glucose 4-epimerase
MLPRRVLVTGASRSPGAELARALVDDPRVEHVIGIDVTRPDSDLGGVEFIRADIRNPLIAKVIASTGADTVAHLGVVATPSGSGGRAAMKEINVIGTLQVLAACQKSPRVRRLVVRSSTAIYGASPADPAVCTEDMEALAMPAGGYGKDAVQLEAYTRGFARRRPDVSIVMLRFAYLIGPRTQSALARYLSLPVVPTPLGYDPRLQFLHEDDATDVLVRTTTEEFSGTFNVGGEGVVLLSQAVRRAGRVAVPVLAPAGRLAGRTLRRLGLIDFSPEQLRHLQYARVADTSRLRELLGWAPAYSSVAAFDDFVRTRVRASVPAHA